MAVSMTGWITRSATTRPLPAPSLPASREVVLEAVLNPSRLPTPPAIALRVVEAASRPECRPGEIVALLSQDPGLCAKLLKAVNSVQYGLIRPVGSIERAVIVVGLNKVRSLALGLSLPAMRPQSRSDPAAREHSLAAVGGAIIARELSARLRYPAPENDLVAGLLRDLGGLLLQQTFPAAWATLAAHVGDPLEEEQCQREREVFGVDHAEVAAELLRSWNLPDDVIEPIRHHHHPDRLVGTPRASRAELLWFAGLLTRLEATVEYPAALDRVLAVAEDRFSLPRTDLAEFLQEIVPKIDQFAKLLSRDIGNCPDYGAILTAGEDELLKLTANPG